MVDEAIATEELIRVPETREQIDAILILASDYLAEKIKSAWKPDSPEDKEMRQKGAELQQRLTQFIIEGYDDSSPEASRVSRFQILEQLKPFWEGCRRLVIRPLASKGYNLSEVPPNTGMFMVLALENGVRGMVATWLMAKAAGWNPKLPPVEQDVSEGKDLILEKNGKEVPLQVKCHEGGKFIVTRAGQLILVSLPAPEQVGNRFYRDPKLGIPHQIEFQRFSAWLENQLRERK